MFIRAYLRASTKEQDATRAKQQLTDFAQERGQKIACYYTENESGATLKRPELMKLIDEAHEGDVLLVEQVDRLSRLSEADWAKLRAIIDSKGLVIVALDLPTSWNALQAQESDTFTRQMLKAVNGMLLDMLAAIARKDYENRRQRQAQGVQKAKAEGKYRGQAPDTGKRERVRRLLDEGKSWNDIVSLTGISRGLVAKVAKELRQAQPGQ
ncbi:hypothetical protein BI343_15935 [Chromobacterium amazonense]|uniref:recombinase family protein n=1 Tax=Chromobacterium amazonense TaxID=1382803 RepID=UPI0008DA4EB5|nr:recombinase family protein [Chromobacterium amazonense]OHX16070.1 hypothetical protein BI343_15935 [Chromobacterium amazonense]